jgi:hypothetical protein
MGSGLVGPAQPQRATKPLQEARALCAQLGAVLAVDRVDDTLALATSRTA